MVVALKRQDCISGLFWIVPDNRRAPHISFGTVAQLALISGQPGHISILVPRCDRIPLERLWEPFVQTGNIDQVVHALLFVKLKGDSAALPPSTCSPMGFKVSVVDPLDVKFSIVFAGNIVLVFQLRTNDRRIGDPVEGRQLRNF